MCNINNLALGFYKIKREPDFLCLKLCQLNMCTSPSWIWIPVKRMSLKNPWKRMSPKNPRRRIPEEECPRKIPHPFVVQSPSSAPGSLVITQLIMRQRTERLDHNDNTWYKAKQIFDEMSFKIQNFKIWTVILSLQYIFKAVQFCLNPERWRSADTKIGSLEPQQVQKDPVNQENYHLPVVFVLGNSRALKSLLTLPMPINFIFGNREMGSLF